MKQILIAWETRYTEIKKLSSWRLQDVFAHQLSAKSYCRQLDPWLSMFYNTLYITKVMNFI